MQRILKKDDRKSEIRIRVEFNLVKLESFLHEYICIVLEIYINLYKCFHECISSPIYYCLFKKSILSENQSNIHVAGSQYRIPTAE